MGKQLSRDLIKLSLGLIGILLASVSLACGTNPNTIIQGPIKTSDFTNGQICFQRTSDKRDIEFHLSYQQAGQQIDQLVDTYEYSDAPAELHSVLFASVNGEQNVVVLLRWHVDFAVHGREYPYYYEIISYRPNGKTYQLNLNDSVDRKLSGYDVIEKGKIKHYPLDNANKIKQYLAKHYNQLWRDLWLKSNPLSAN